MNWVDNFDFKSLSTSDIAEVMRHLSAESKHRSESLMAAISTLERITQSQEAQQRRTVELEQQLAVAVQQTSALSKRVAWLELIVGQK